MDSLLRKAILEVMPADGSGIGSQKLAEAVTARMTGYGKTATPADVQRVKEALIAEGLLDKGSGRGGSVYLARPNDDGGSLVLTTPPQPGELALSARPAGAKPRPGVPRQRVADGDAAEILSYRHPDKRKNNPEVGMVRPENDPSEPDNRWCYDPHIDPALQFDFGRAGVEKLIDDALASGGESAMRVALEELKRYSAPYLNWTGKAERTSFEVDTISLHVHERIDPASILSAVRKRLGERRSPDAGAQRRNSGGTPPDSATLHPGYAYQPDLFAAPFENLPLRDAIDFYKHERGWANRLIAGDSLLVMNSLLQKESLAGQVQMIYIDPPYGIKYGSNFQPFVNKRDVKDRKDEDLTSEPEMIKAFRDTWELGIHSYLTYLRDRLLLAKELLHESGSVFVQISDENLHLVRNLIDEIFEADNFCGQISFRTTGGQSSALLSGSVDYLLWYAKDKASAQRKYHVLTKPKAIGNEAKHPSPAGGRGAGGEGVRAEGDWYEVEVHGFDYFDTARGELVSGGKGRIAMWLLDTDYDERSLFPRQVFFPMAGKQDGWYKLKKNFRAELNESLLDKFHGTVSLPFAAGENRKVAVKIVDDRGIESLKIIPLD